MSFYQNPYFNHTYTPKTDSNIMQTIAASGFNILNNPASNPEFFPYLCQLLKLANIAEVDPVVKIESNEEFDYNKYLEPFYMGLSAIDEGRVNFYDVWQHISETIIPRALTQIEIAQEGGCQIIEDYICDASGEKIKKVSSLCDVTSEYSKPITKQELDGIVESFMNQKKDTHADNLIDHVKNNFINNGWIVELIYLEKFYSFFIRCVKNNYAYFFRYYWDRKEYISNGLNLPVIINNTFSPSLEVPSLTGTNLTQALMEPIPKNYS